jgi:hypothetical protein
MTSMLPCLSCQIPHPWGFASVEWVDNSYAQCFFGQAANRRHSPGPLRRRFINLLSCDGLSTSQICWISAPPHSVYNTDGSLFINAGCLGSFRPNLFYSESSLDTQPSFGELAWHSLDCEPDPVIDTQPSRPELVSHNSYREKWLVHGSTWDRSSITETLTNCDSTGDTSP